MYQSVHYVAVPTSKTLQKAMREQLRYFYIAKGSSAEVLTQATIAFEIGYIQKETFKEIEKGV